MLTLVHYNPLWRCLESNEFHLLAELMKGVPMIRRLPLRIATLVILSAASFASSDKRMPLDDRAEGTMPPTSLTVESALNLDSGLVAIYNNIGTVYPKGRYSTNTGGVVGPKNQVGSGEYWLANAFIPNADYKVEKIVVAAVLVSGTNGLVVSLYDDKYGIPNSRLKSWFVTNLPPLGSCCSVEVAYDGSSVEVAGGKQYWVVLQTGPSNQDTWAGWVVNDTDQVDPSNTASYCSNDDGGSSPCGEWNDHWMPIVEPMAYAFAVLGTQ